MVLALVIPALLRLLQDDEPEETRPAGVSAAAVLDRDWTHHAEGPHRTPPAELLL